MKRRSKKPSQKQSASEAESSQSQQDVNKEYVKAQRSRKNVKKTETNDSIASQNNLSNSQQGDVLDIHHGDSFIREHVRPSFLKRWDGHSNTLQLTQAQLDDLSPMLRVYWEHKAKNMNCIIFAQIGKVQFFAFEDDAIKLHQIFKKRLKKFSSFLMVNFWSKEIEVAKVELFQRRIPVLMLNQIEDQQYKRNFGIFKREITEVITPSIFLSMEPKKFRERMMLAIFISGNKCGVACVDVETNHFYLEQYEENQVNSVHEIRRLINKYRPAELLIQKKDQFIKKIAKQVCSPYVIEMASDSAPIVQNIKAMKEASQDQFFERVLKLYNKNQIKQQSEFSLYSIIKVLSLILSYLKNLGLQAKIFGQGIFQLGDFDAVKLKPMFDAQVYENLQVFSLKDEQDSFGKTGTLFHYLNHCVTQSGVKLLKKWVDQPLRTIIQISKRQIAIENLLEDETGLLATHKQLIKFEKLERRIGSIYHWALNKNEQGKMILTKQLKFDKDYDQRKNPAVVRIKQVYDVLKTLLSVQNQFKKLSKFDISSQMLKKCCKIVETGDLYHITRKNLQNIQGLPSIQNLISKLLNKIQVDDQTGIIEPAPGINEVFDMEKAEVDKINNQLQQILSKWKKKLGVSKAAYVSVRARNEIEVPLSQVKNKKFPQLIFSSQTSKMIRYVTSQVINLSQQLVVHQQAIALAYEPFLGMMVKQFCSHKHIWDIYLNAIAKLDVLMSLAKASKSMQPRCLPSFHSQNQSGVCIVNGFHPGLLQVKAREKIVGNTLRLEDQKRILLLTGPNMGGKSTLLRQTCLLAILAQIGSFVPCQKYQSIVFDQIFCRIGASDRLIQGKSTFYVQLQQTKRIIDQATPNSLAIIDQLGRGTSTYDGMAIASAILKHLSQQVQCYTLFSTHYLPLTKFCVDQKMVCGKMGYKLNQENQKIQFNYQLQEGVAEKSFANQVAMQVGISTKTLEIADQKAREMQIANSEKKISKAFHNHRKNLIQQIKQFAGEGM